jgi:hypothetical protein
LLYNSNLNYVNVVLLQGDKDKLQESNRNHGEDSTVPNDNINMHKELEKEAYSEYNENEEGNFIEQDEECNYKGLENEEAKKFKFRKGKN